MDLLLLECAWFELVGRRSEDSLSSAMVLATDRDCFYQAREARSVMSWDPVRQAALVEHAYSQTRIATALEKARHVLWSTVLTMGRSSQ